MLILFNSQSSLVEQNFSEKGFSSEHLHYQLIHTRFQFNLGTKNGSLYVLYIVGGPARNSQLKLPQNTLYYAKKEYNKQWRAWYANRQDVDS